MTVKESTAFAPFHRVLAVYKGMTVAVYRVNKTELSLTRNDLIELINVRSFCSST